MALLLTFVAINAKGDSLKRALVFLSDSQTNAEITVEAIENLDGLSHFKTICIMSYDEELLETVKESCFDEIFVHMTKGMPEHRKFLRTFYKLFDEVKVVIAGEIPPEDFLGVTDEILCRDAAQWGDESFATV